MAPSFLKDLRRRSKATFATDKSSDKVTDSEASSSTIPTSQSSSTVDSAGLFGRRTSPGASNNIPAQASYPNLQTLHQYPSRSRPGLSTSSSSNRNSVNGMAGLGGPMNNLPTSQYAPRITSIKDGSWCYQKVLLIYGTIADPATQAMDGIVRVSRVDDDFPAVNWPVNESHFKALVYLNPGPNKLRFDFTSPKVANSGTSNPIHSTTILIHMMPMTNSPPLQLCILVGSDSPGTFDSTPARIEKEGNGLDTAIKKFRMCAYLWQAFTAEQMYRQGFGRRCFRFEEEWQTGTSNYRDRELGTLRNEAKVHVIRSSRTTAQLRSPAIAQQNPKATDKNGLFNIAGEDLKAYFTPSTGQTIYASVLILDAHWDPLASLITGHAALGAGSGAIRMGICGSHALHSYPTSIEEVVPAFTDCTRTDTNYVANDSNESSSSWEACNIGIGAHLHETGHMFGSPHQESGVMLRDYVTLNRSFVTKEAFCVRTNLKGGLVLPDDECQWHRLDCLRFRSHPCFRMPNDMKLPADRSVSAWPVDHGNVLITAACGVAFIEIRSPDEEVCHAWIEYGDGNGKGPLQRQVLLTETDVKSKLPESMKGKKLNLTIHSFGGETHNIDDFDQLSSKASTLKLATGNMAFRGAKLGLSNTAGSKPVEVIFESAGKQPKLLMQVKVYHGLALDGIEFVYEDSSSQLFGKRGGQPGGSVFDLDTRRGEYIIGFQVKSGWWIDGIQILTSTGRTSEFYGKQGGSSHTLIPPRGYSVAGISGSYGQWVDGFSLIITR